jgi:hypothetical protein
MNLQKSNERYDSIVGVGVVANETGQTLLMTGRKTLPARNLTIVSKPCSRIRYWHLRRQSSALGGVVRKCLSEGRLRI